ncbi:MAG: hypothetical protein II453_17395 [Alphaproteobacteria bacterium]|nr:hypothetical protein [Alphaproteobacteria bacterium]
MNPVIEGYISYSDLKNGTLNLYDIFVLNEVINYKERLGEEARRKALRESALRKKV